MCLIPLYWFMVLYMHVCRILLKLWEEMAESYIERLKPNDFIYVAGTLESYKKADKCGKSFLSYEVGCSIFHLKILFFLTFSLSKFSVLCYVVILAS